MRRLFIALAACLFVGQYASAQTNNSFDQEYFFENLYHEALKAKVKGDYQKAFDTFIYLVKRNPNNAAVLNELAILLNGTQDFANAAEFAEKAVQVDTTGNENYIVNAIAFLNNANKKERTIALYDKLIALKPDDDKSKIAKYEALIDLGHYDEALKMASKFKTDDPETKLMLETGKISIYASQNKLKKAIKLAHSLEKKYPRNAQILYLLSNLYGATGDNEKVVKYGVMSTKCPNGDVYLFFLAETYRLLSMDSLYASTMLDGFMSQEVNEVYKIQRVYQIFGDSNMFSNANWRPFIVKVFSSLLQQYPSNPEIVSLADSYFTQNNNEGLGAELLEKFVAENPGTNYIWIRIIAHYQGVYLAADAENKKATLDKLISCCVRASDDLPNDPSVAFYHGLFLTERKDYAGALKPLQTAYSIWESAGNKQEKNGTVPNRLDVLNSMALCYMHLDSVSQAVMVFDHILSENPDDAVALNNYAYELAQRGIQLDKAERMSRRALDMEPLNSSYLDTYAYVLFRKGNYSEATFVMERCMDLLKNQANIDFSVYYDHCGDIYFKVGRVEEAVEMWRLALELDPANKLIERKFTQKQYFAE